MKLVAIIPARYASTRFPAKPLALLGGKPIIQHVYERISAIIEDCYVATDDMRIIKAVTAIGGKAIMTSSHHRSGTERCQEALERIRGDYDYVINVQGDEPFITEQQILNLISCFEHSTTDIATLATAITPKMGLQVLQDSNSPKVVKDSQGFALYFSRSIIPFVRNMEPEQWLTNHTFWKHIGIYAYRTTVLRKITQLPYSPLEQAESLEQLRWLEAGFKIRVGISDIETIGIDTPEDLIQAEYFLQTKA